MRTIILVFISLVGGAGLLLVLLDQSDRPIPSISEIRAILSDGADGPLRQLVRLGERAFPTYESILSDPAVTAREAARIFGLLRDVKAERSRFAEYTGRWLTADEADASRQAAHLLSQIGNRSDASLLVALLWDQDGTIVGPVVTRLGAIGGGRELTALDIWARIKAEKLHADDDLRRHLQQARDAIQRRIEAEKKSIS
jgi:hypothetical protein